MANKKWFVKVFNRDDHDNFKTVRDELAKFIYDPIHKVSLLSLTVRWLNEDEVGEAIKRYTWEDIDVYGKGFLFHATSKIALKSIFEQKKVKVRHEKAYRGAFVSTKPELSFGPVVLAFRKNIEYLSPLTHGFAIDQHTYWAGFSRDIPVNTKTLAYIILNSSDIAEKKSLETECKAWAGKEWGSRKITILLWEEIEDKLQKIQNLNMGIPKEWGDEGKVKGQKILLAMKLAIAIPQPMTLEREPSIQQHEYIPQPIAHAQKQNNQRVMVLA